MGRPHTTRPNPRSARTRHALAHARARIPLTGLLTPTARGPANDAQEARVLPTPETRPDRAGETASSGTPPAPRPHSRSPASECTPSRSARGLLMNMASASESNGVACTSAPASHRAEKAAVARVVAACDAAGGRPLPPRRTLVRTRRRVGASGCLWRKWGPIRIDTCVHSNDRSNLLESI